MHGISFTGGTATGRIVASIAAPMFKKLSLELGGKNAAIVFCDCDMNKAVHGVLRASFTNQGQVCLAASRILVQKPIFDEFVARLVSETEKLVVGNPLDSNTNLGPVSSSQHLEKIQSYVQQAIKEGGTVLTGGREPSLPEPFSNGAFITPCIISVCSRQTLCLTFC